MLRLSTCKEIHAREISPYSRCVGEMITLHINKNYACRWSLIDLGVITKTFLECFCWNPVVYRLNLPAIIVTTTDKCKISGTENVWLYRPIKQKASLYTRIRVDFEWHQLQLGYYALLSGVGPDSSTWKTTPGQCAIAGTCSNGIRQWIITTSDFLRLGCSIS